MNERITIRPLVETDYDNFLVKWWNDWGWNAPARDFLPNNALDGLMVLCDGVEVCAGFVYNTNSKVAWIDWIISDKDFREKEPRREAIRYLIEMLSNMAIAVGAKYLYALIKNESLVNTYKGLGYIEGDVYNREMIKIL